jgi:hypothetical protein
VVVDYDLSVLSLLAWFRPVGSLPLQNIFFLSSSSCRPCLAVHLLVESAALVILSASHPKLHSQQLPRTQKTNHDEPQMASETIRQQS